jgi:predicted Rossmann fold nucleotide-binding protein DprA/Smf involved in DNA uptake
MRDYENFAIADNIFYLKSKGANNLIKSAAKLVDSLISVFEALLPALVRA